MTSTGEPLNLASFSQQQPSAADLFNEWAPQDDCPPNQQFQLPESFFTDWPFDVGQGEAFDFLGAFQQASQQTNGNSNGFPAATGSNSNNNNENNGHAREGGIQDILGVGVPEGFIGAGQLGGVLGSLGFPQASTSEGHGA